MVHAIKQDGDIPTEIDFTGAVHVKFFSVDAQLNVPLHQDAPIAVYCLHGRRPKMNCVHGIGLCSIIKTCFKCRNNLVYYTQPISNCLCFFLQDIKIVAFTYYVWFCMKIVLIFSVAFFSCFGAVAQTPSAVKQDFQAVIWALSCTSCHGTDGKAEGVGLYIAGRKPNELHSILLDYKSGQRKGTIMHQHAKGYSDSELKRIAVYFSEVK